MSDVDQNGSADQTIVPGADDPDESGRLPVWFIAIRNLSRDMRKSMAEHEAKDAERHDEAMTRSAAQGDRIGALERRIGIVGLVGGALGSAGPQLIEWLLK